MRLVSIALLMIAAASAGAAEWVKYGESAKGTVYYLDPGTISRDGNLRRVATVQDLKERNQYGELSRAVMLEFDCKQRRYRGIFLSTFADSMANGKKLGSNDSSSGWYPITSGTPGENALRTVCAR